MDTYNLTLSCNVTEYVYPLFEQLKSKKLQNWLFLNYW